MASIKKRGNKWQARITTFDKDGNRIQPSKTFNTKADAQYWANQNEVRKHDGDSLTQTNKTFAQYFEDWYLLYKKPKLRRATRVWYENTQRHIKDYFGADLLRDIKREDYQRFINHLAETLVKKTVQKIHGHIRSCVTAAVEDEHIRHDFTSRATITGVTVDEQPVRFLNAYEMGELLKYAKRNLRVKASGRYMIITALYTGARLAEIGGLTWSDINFDWKTISISKTYDYDAKENAFADTKNYQSKRIIKVNDELLQFFRLLRDQQDNTLSHLHIDNPLDLVFINDLGSVPGSTALNKLLRKLLAMIDGIRPEVKELNFHGLRHTHASYLLYQGVSIYYISKRLGHKNITTTLNTYSHVISELEHEESGKTLEALSKVTCPQSIIPTPVAAQ